MSPFVSSFFKKCSIAVSYVAIPCIMSVLVLQSGATNVSELCLGRVSIKFFFFFWWDTYGMCRHVSASIHGKKMKSSIWGTISFRLIWNIWRERNMLNFEGREQLVAQLKSQLLGILFEWQYSESSSVLFYLDMFALWTACIWMD